MKGINTVVNFLLSELLVLRGAHYFPRCSGESRLKQKGIEMYVGNKCPTLGYKVYASMIKKMSSFFFFFKNKVNQTGPLQREPVAFRESNTLFLGFSKILKISHSRGPGKSNKFSNLCCMSKRFLAYRVEFFYRRFSEKTLSQMFKHPWEFILTWLV